MTTFLTKTKKMNNNSEQCIEECLLEKILDIPDEKFNSKNIPIIEDWEIEEKQFADVQIGNDFLNIPLPNIIVEELKDRIERINYLMEKGSSLKRAIKNIEEELSKLCNSMEYIDNGNFLNDGNTKEE